MQAILGSSVYPDRGPFYFLLIHHFFKVIPAFAYYSPEPKTDHRFTGRARATSGVSPQKSLPNGMRRLAHPCGRLELGVLPRYTFVDLLPRSPLDDLKSVILFRKVVY